LSPVAKQTGKRQPGASALPVTGSRPSREAPNPLRSNCGGLTGPSHLCAAAPVSLLRNEVELLSASRRADSAVCSLRSPAAEYGRGRLSTAAEGHPKPPPTRVKDLSADNAWFCHTPLPKGTRPCGAAAPPPGAVSCGLRSVTEPVVIRSEVLHPPRFGRPRLLFSFRSGRLPFSVGKGRPRGLVRSRVLCPCWGAGTGTIPLKFPFPAPQTPLPFLPSLSLPSPTALRAEPDGPAGRAPLRSSESNR